jgi:hypothetical protein
MARLHMVAVPARMKPRASKRAQVEGRKEPWGAEEADSKRPRPRDFAFSKIVVFVWLWVTPGGQSHYG